ncbi:MAG: hypothetical protein WCC84_05150 [Candidatus Cybelea sp.]
MPFCLRLERKHEQKHEHKHKHQHQFVDLAFQRNSAPLQLSSAPTGITLDQAGNLLVTQSDGVAVFAPGQTSPTSWIGYGLQPFGLAFGNNGNWLYVVANGYPCYFSCVNVYSYPAGSRIGQYSLPGSSSYFGIALSPRVPLFSPSAMRHRHPHFRYWTDLRRGVRKK